MFKQQLKRYLRKTLPDSSYAHVYESYQRFQTSGLLNEKSVSSLILQRVEIH